MNAIDLANRLENGYTGPAAEAAVVLRQQAAEIQQLKKMVERLMETLEWTQDRMRELAA